MQAPWGKRCIPSQENRPNLMIKRKGYGRNPVSGGSIHLFLPGDLWVEQIISTDKLLCLKAVNEDFGRIFFFSRTFTG